MSIDVSTADTTLSEADVEAALNTIDGEIRDVVVVEDNIFVLLEWDTGESDLRNRNIIALAPDGSRRWRSADHPKLKSPFQSLHYDDQALNDFLDIDYEDDINRAGALTGYTHRRTFLISPETGELEFVTSWK